MLLIQQATAHLITMATNVVSFIMTVQMWLKMYSLLVQMAELLVNLRFTIRAAN